MATKLLLIVSVLLSSCASNFSQRKLNGTYRAKGKDYACELKLAQDSSFQLTTWRIETKSSCQGTWRMITMNAILLQCASAQLYEELQGGYMSEREKKVTVLNNRKLKLGSIKLKIVKK